ncbi:MAG: O-acetylhomoserine aminocarboxypropyltransferase/cysteine synthase family protein, partial [Gammaproteobacteria bacterium]
MTRDFGFHTRAIHAGARHDQVTGARALPIYQTSSYVFEDAESAAAYFNLQEYGNTYARIMNPTVAALEERLANLEGGVGAVAFASGLAAQSAALFTLLEPGDHVVASAALYGGTVTQLKHLLRKLSVELTFVDPDDSAHWQAALRPNTKLFFAETIGNPAGNVLDIEAVAAIAHGHGLPLLVDNTFATPYLCRPLEFGADIVVHSTTKFIGGHGTSIGGAVVDAGTFDWSNGRYPIVAAPSPAYHGLPFHENFGIYGYLMKLRAETLRDLGAAMSPFNAFLFAQGLETLPLRMRQHVANA